MFWDKKEDDKEGGLPDLPPVKTTPLRSEVDEPEETERHPLPTFPDSKTHNKFSEAAIKDAVKPGPPESNIPEFPEERSFKTTEMEEWAPESKDTEANNYPEEEINPNIPAVEEAIPEKIYPKPLPSSSTQQTKPDAQDIFVKIDKFRTVRKALKDTQRKLEEIDSLLHKIREVKMREEQEIATWEKEISSAKARIQEITSSIFEKVK